MFVGTDIIYTYDATIEGFFTCVFDAYQLKQNPLNITSSNEIQQMIGARIKYVETDTDKSNRVFNGIKTKMGTKILDDILMAHLSENPQKDIILFNYIKLGFKIGRRLDFMLSDDFVIKVVKMNRYIGYELSKLLGFTRFSKLENNIYYGEISPKNNLLPVLMEHFSGRFNKMPFILNDVGREIAGVYDMNEWYMLSSKEINIPKYSSDEKEYLLLWKKFYDTIAVTDRKNEKCKQGLMPKRFWKHMPELNGSIDIILNKIESGKEPVGQIRNENLRGLL
jgi:probable DNA metabolism protein